MLSFDVHADLTAAQAAAAARVSRTRSIVAAQVLKDTSPFVPFRTGSLDQRSRVQDDMIIYPGPYARYLYFGKVMVDRETGRGPFYIDEVGFRFRKGAVLTPTGRDLKFDRSFHHKATARWFEVSKAQNLQKWLRVAQKAVNNG